MAQETIGRIGLLVAMDIILKKKNSDSKLPEKSMECSVQEVAM